MKKAYKPYKHLSYTDRQLIELYLSAGMRVSEIAKNIGVHRNTIYREFTRCGMTKENYNADKAQKYVQHLRVERKNVQSNN